MKNREIQAGEIREIAAIDRGRKCRIWVSPRMKNTDCIDGETVRGWWYCYASGEATIAFFVTKRPESGCVIQGINDNSALEQSELDVFNTNNPIKDKADFARHLNM